MLTKSTGRLLVLQNARKSFTHALSAVAGPPTLSFASTPLIASTCVAIEREIVVLLSRTESGEVRLVPHFKEPLADFRETIALHPMGHDLADEDGPLGGIAWWRDIGIGSEIGSDCLTPEPRGMKLSSTNGFMPMEEQKIKYLISVEKRIEHLVAFADQRSHVVRQDSVKTDMVETTVPPRLL